MMSFLAACADKADSATLSVDILNQQIASFRGWLLCLCKKKNNPQ